MNKQEITRLVIIEKRLKEYFTECGLNIVDTDFEIVTSARMIEALAKHLPTNFSHWSFGRDYEREKTQYDYTGHGIPYEVVWNFDKPIALLVDTNPFALNALIIAHVFGHVDFHVSNRIMQNGRKMVDVMIEARSAKKRFEEYRKLYGDDEVDNVIEAAMAFQLHQDPDLFAEDISEEDKRKMLVSNENNKLNSLKNELALAQTEEGRAELKHKIANSEVLLSKYERMSPPVPEYDILKYLLEHAPKAKKPWVHDIISVIREQMRAFAPNRRTKLMNEGWASYWHVRGLRWLVSEGLMTNGECEEAIKFHAGVVQKHLAGFNVYSIGLSFWEHVEDAYNKGKFGPEWEKCKNRYNRANWDKKIGKGREKMLELRQVLSDRMAIENFFTDDFIEFAALYIYQSHIVEDDEGNQFEEYFIAEDRPPVIREILRRHFSTSGIPNVSVRDGNANRSGELIVEHHFSGFELDPKFENGALEKLYYLWEKTVHLITYEIESADPETGKIKLRQILHTYNGRNHIEHNT
jgi:stage V sporulation protein R